MQIIFPHRFADFTAVDEFSMQVDRRFVEYGPSEEVFDTPASDYTRLLLDTAPRINRLAHSSL